MQGILIATLVVGVVGLVLGLALVTASKKFYVETDERVTQVRECLRGANCGACGYAGCDAVAEAIVKGEARVDACPGNSTENIARIAAILGKEAIDQDPQVAYVRCAGTCEATKAKANYVGLQDCRAAVLSGGLGFMVWVEIGQYRKKHRLSLQAKVVLSFSVILWLGGAALIALMEWNNPASMGGLSVPGKLMAALFQSVSTRTAGMNTIDLAACGPITKLLMSVLQFIGAAPGSTGGGVKVTTFAVIILTIRSVAQGRDDCVIAEHHIESKTVYRALTIIVLGGLAAVGSAVVVFYNTSDAVSVIDAIFESCSAFGTVGLSVGVTAQLNRGAKILYMLVMFMGRVGPVSLAMSLTAKPDDNKRKIMPVGHINVG